MVLDRLLTLDIMRLTQWVTERGRVHVHTGICRRLHDMLKKYVPCLLRSHPNRVPQSPALWSPGILNLCRALLPWVLPRGSFVRFRELPSTHKILSKV